MKQMKTKGKKKKKKKTTKTKKKKPTTATNKIWKKVAAMPRWIWAVGSAIALAVVIAWLMFAPAQKEAPPAPFSSGMTRTGGVPGSQSPASAAIPGVILPMERPAFIHAVRLQPSQPTRMDSLKAEVEAAPAAPEKLVYTYLWKVNGRVIEETVGDTLNLSAFHKWDLVTVTVTPYDGKTAGLAVVSPFVAIHSVPPSLDLKAMRRVRKTGEPIELQLVGTAPDGDTYTFSLEAPHVPGMSIDQRSGKISWRLQPDQKGVFRFGAAVEDDNGTKVTKIFAITAE